MEHTTWEPTQKSFSNSPVDLYKFIVANLGVQHEVLAVSRSISPEIDTIITAMLVLGFNTVKEIAIVAFENGNKNYA